MRWFGPNDPVSLRDIRQAGCEGVVTALHHIPVGEVWTVAEIEKRKQIIEAAGLSWTVVESLPVHEDIKKQTGDFEGMIARYQESLRNLAQCGLKVITYNFMPILDWLRTNPIYELPDGSRALYFERVAFIAFDLFLLQRPNAAADYSEADLQSAESYFLALDESAKKTLFQHIMLGLPGSDEAFTADQVLSALATYKAIDTARLKEHLFYFLRAIVPLAESLGLRLAIHPDDPPYAVLGLPRIVCTEQDLQEIVQAVPSPANGLCFCTGSLGVRADNDLVGIIRRMGDHIHFLHLRNTKRDQAGNFFEADHLTGDTDMVAIVSEILKLSQRKGKSIPMRPDHGHQMLDDLNKKTYPGYSAIGRLRALAELRGLELGLAHHLEK